MVLFHPHEGCVPISLRIAVSAFSHDFQCLNVLFPPLPKRFQLLPFPLFQAFVLSLAGVDGSTPVHAVTHNRRAALVKVLKAFPVTVSGTRPIDEAVVTAGGISTKEINPRTMESKIVPGLYFAGEVLDLDAYTGGFNLQIAWCTAFTAANAVIKNLHG